MPFTGVGGGGGVAASSLFVLGADYVANDRVLDANINVWFVCLLPVTAATLRPSEDPDNWLGYDDYKLGRLSLMATNSSSGPSLALSDSATAISRTKYIRLFRKSCPQLVCRLVSGSTTLSLPPGASVRPGMVLEAAGVPLGTTIATTGAGVTKVGTLTAGLSRIFFRAGVAVPATTNPSEVTGTGLAANTTATTTAADIVSTLSSVAGSPNLLGTTAVTAYDNAAIGCYASGASLAANSRVIQVSPRVVTLANNRDVTGSPNVYCSCDLYSQIADSTLFAGRTLSMTGLASASIGSLLQPEEIAPGTWQWITTTGWFAPYNATGGTIAKLLVDRKISGGPVTDAASSHIVTVNAATTRTASFDAGSAMLFWVNAGSVAAPANFSDRYAGSVTAGLQPDTYVTAQTAQTVALQIASTLGSATLCANVGSALVPTVGRYVTVTAAGITDQRITTSSSQFTDTQVRTVTGTNLIYVSPTDVGVLANTLYRVGQKFTVAGITANSTLTALGSVFQSPTVSISSTVNNTRLFLPATELTTNAAEWFVNRRVVGTGLAAGSLISSITADVVISLDIGLGLTEAYLSVGSGATALWNNAYVTAAAGVSAPTRISNTQIETTSASARTVLGGTQVFLAAGTVVTGLVIGQRVTVAGGNLNSSITQTPVSQFTSTNSSTVLASNQLYLQPGLSVTGTVIGQGISGLNIPAATTIAAVGADTSIAKYSLTVAVASVYLPVGATAAPFVVGTKITGTGIAANTNISAVGAEATSTVVGVTSGVSRLFVTVGGATTPLISQRYVSLLGVPVDTRLSGALAAQATQTLNTTTTGSVNVYRAGGAVAGASVLVGAYVTAGGIVAPAQISALVADASTTATSSTVNASTTVRLSPNFSAAQVLAGRGLSGAGIPANARIASVTNPPATIVNCTYGTAVTVLNCPSTAGVVAGANILGAGITAGTTVSSFTGTTITISAGTTASGTNTSVGIGARVVISAAATATAAAVSLTLTGYIVTDTASTLGATGTLTIGANIATSAAATVTTAAGATATFGAVHTLSAVAASTQTDITVGLLGRRLTMSANATAAAATTTVTFLPWLEVSGPAAATVTATATFGAVLTLNTAATATLTLAAGVVGGCAVLSAAATANLSNGAVDLGRRLTVSANATATATASTAFAAWAETAVSATTTTTGLNGNFGAITTVNAACTASSLTTATVTFGTNVVPVTVTAATVRAVTNVKLGAVLVASTNALTTNPAVAITFGPALVLDNNAVATASATISVAGFTDLDTPAASSQIDQPYSFGASVTLSAAATANNEAATVRFFPYGYGDSNGVTGTTFNLPYDVSGRVLMVAGQGTGLTNRAVNSTVGAETHQLTGLESGTAVHGHGNTIAASYVGQNLIAASGTGATAAGFIANSAAGTSTYNMTMAGAVTNSTAVAASQSHNNMQPSKAVGMSLAIYAGAM